MRKKISTKLISCFLALALMVGLLPISAFADENPSQDLAVGGSVIGTVYGAVGDITVTLTDNTVTSDVYSDTLGQGIMLFKTVDKNDECYREK